MPSITLSSPGAIALKLGPITLRWYGIIIASGALIASWAAAPLAKRRGLDVDNLLNCLLVCFVGGVIGARLYFVALSWPNFQAHPEEIFATWLGGLSIHGGIIGGAIAGYIYARLTKLPFLDGFDVAGAVVPLAQSIGRWGNFFNSEAFGQPVPEGFPIKLEIPLQSRPAAFLDAQYFHPTFLYESIFDLAIFLLLYFVLFDRFKNYKGMTFLAYLALYSFGRLLIEPLRTDSIMVGQMAAPFVVSAVILIASSMGMLIMWMRQRNKQPSTPADKVD